MGSENLAATALTSTFPTWLSRDVCQTLQHSFHIPRLYPYQERCVAHILQAAQSNLRSDVCIASPTGSGKTLCYAIPIIQALGSRSTVPVSAQRRRQMNVKRAEDPLRDTSNIRSADFCTDAAMSPCTRSVECLVLLPCKDAAKEISEVFERLCSHYAGGLHTALINGSISYEKEHSLMSCAIRLGTDDATEIPYSFGRIVVGTPRRVLEHVVQDPALLQHLRFLVLDEADVLLNVANVDWIMKLLALIPDKNETPRKCALVPGSPRKWFPSTVLHTILCSATLTQRAPLFANFGLTNTATFTSGETSLSTEDVDCGTRSLYAERRDLFRLPATLREKLIIAEDCQKPSTLLSLLHHLRLFDAEPLEVSESAKPLVLIFCNTVQATHHLFRLLCIVGLRCVEFTSQFSAHERATNWARSLQKKDVQVLVATDLLSRSVDFDQRISVVIQYDLPRDRFVYVHRSGRTARAGRDGEMYVLCDDANLSYVHHLRSRILPPFEIAHPTNRFSLETSFPLGSNAAERLRDAITLVGVVLRLEQRQILKATQRFLPDRAALYALLREKKVKGELGKNTDALRSMPQESKPIVNLFAIEPAVAKRLRADLSSKQEIAEEGSDSSSSLSDVDESPRKASRALRRQLATITTADEMATAAALEQEHDDPVFQEVGDRYPWICCRCLFINRVDARRRIVRREDTLGHENPCRRCSTNMCEKCRVLTTQQEVEEARHGGAWKCRKCHARNNPKDLKCTRCSRERGPGDHVLFHLKPKSKEVK